MTRTLLAALVDVKDSSILVVGLTLLALFLLPFTILVDLARAITDGTRRLAALGAPTARCGNGHEVELVGTFTCPSCRTSAWRHAYSACPACGVHGDEVVPCPCGSFAMSPIPSEDS
jgi:hypothetical protein